MSSGGKGGNVFFQNTDGCLWFRIVVESNFENDVVRENMSLYAKWISADSVEQDTDSSAQTMNWPWWLLLILLVIAYLVYRKVQEKKKKDKE